MEKVEINQDPTQITEIDKSQSTETKDRISEKIRWLIELTTSRAIIPHKQCHVAESIPPRQLIKHITESDNYESKLISTLVKSKEIEKYEKLRILKDLFRKISENDSKFSPEKNKNNFSKIVYALAELQDKNTITTILRQYLKEDDKKDEVSIIASACAKFDLNIEIFFSHNNKIKSTDLSMLLKNKSIEELHEILLIYPNSKITKIIGLKCESHKYSLNYEILLHTVFETEPAIAIEVVYNKIKFNYEKEKHIKILESFAHNNLEALMKVAKYTEKKHLRLNALKKFEKDQDSYDLKTLNHPLFSIILIKNYKENPSLENLKKIAKHKNKGAQKFLKELVKKSENDHNNKLFLDLMEIFAINRQELDNIFNTERILRIIFLSKHSSYTKQALNILSFLHEAESILIDFLKTQFSTLKNNQHKRDKHSQNQQII